MAWDKINERHKKKYERNYVSCHEPYEREYMIGLIIEHFPQFRRSTVQQAIDHACKTVSSPRDIKKFLKCMEEYLSVPHQQLKKEFGFHA